MSYALNNVTPAADYSAAATLSCPNSRAVTAQVFNAAVYYQLALDSAGVASRIGSEQWEAETLLGPGYWRFDQLDFRGGVCHGIRFRLVTSTGQVPQVSASA